MEIGKQIKKMRSQMGMSQDELALKVYVSRQTISSWENNKSYPDVKSLLLLSSEFNLSLDQLVKGDVEEMKEVINNVDIKAFKKDSKTFNVLFLMVIVSAVPLALALKFVGMAIWALMAGVLIVYALKLERFKKKHDIQTYKEILSFLEGERLESADKHQEIGKRPYQRIFLALVSACLAGLIGIGLLLLAKLFGFI